MSSKETEYCNTPGETPNEARLDPSLNAVVDLKGVYLGLYGGHKYYPADPGNFTIPVEDYAQSLSLQCRYGGHAEFHYSVAQHQLLMAKWLYERHGPQVAYAGLHHDGSETVLTDVTRPLKPFLSGYFELEGPAQARIYELFGVPFDDIPPQVKEADNAILYNEGKVLQPFVNWWEFFAPGLEGIEVRERDWRAVRQEFIEYHYWLRERLHDTTELRS